VNWALQIKLLIATVLGTVVCAAAEPGEAPSGEERPGVSDFSSPAGAVPTAELDRAIRDAGDYLIRHCQTSGRFVYRTYLDGRQADLKYNLLRHAGSIYALTQFHDLTRSETALTTMVRATRWLCREFVGPVEGHTGLLAVWTRPEQLGHRQPWGAVQAKLGGAALALLALQRVEARAPDTVPRATLEGLAEFIVFMQYQDGRFCSKFYPDIGRSDSWTSLYYPGEAMLALMTYGGSSEGDRWHGAAVRGMEHLSRARITAGIVPPDHWALLATEPLLVSLDRPGADPARRGLLLEHAKRICRLMLGTQELSPDRPRHLGGFTADGRTCPTAIRLEGLIAAHRVLREADGELRRGIEAACHLGARFLLRSQVQSGELCGGIPRAACAKPDTPGNRAFNSRVPEIRIDYVQHALSAFIGYRHAFVDGKDNVTPREGGARDSRTTNVVK
jgi:hypothetical protein